MYVFLVFFYIFPILEYNKYNPIIVWQRSQFTIA